MGQARLKSLTVKGFRSFAEESTIDFPDSGMILFKGKNLDTGGSSGSGKSSLLLAISYLFGFCRFPSTALQSWLTDEPLSVTGVLQVDAGELTVTRGSKLGVSLNGNPIKGSAKQLEETITKHVGLVPELLAALTYRGQKQPGLFLSKTDSEKKEFLTVLLNLGRFELAVEESQGKATLLQRAVDAEQLQVSRVQAERNAASEIKLPVLQDLSKLDSDIQVAERHSEGLRERIQGVRARVWTHQTEIDVEVRRIQAKAEPPLEEAQKTIRMLREQPLDESHIDRSALEALTADSTQAASFLEAEKQADAVRQRDQRQKAEGVYAQLMLKEKRLATRPGLERQLAQLQSEIAKLDTSVCPTCDRQWEEAQARAEGLRLEVDSVRQSLADLEAVKPQIASLQAEYKALGNFTPNPVIEELRGIVSGLQAQIAEEKARVEGALRLARSKKDTLISQAQTLYERTKADVWQIIEDYRSDAGERLMAAQEELEELERSLRTSEANVRGLQGTRNRAEVDNAREEQRHKLDWERYLKLEQSLGEAEARLADSQRRLNAELDFQKMIGREGFLGAIFDEVLWEISEETNRLLAQFPNTAHVTLHFRSESTTQKGTIKKAITPVVTIGGNEAPLASGLSGGMETAVELAVDLAVAAVVSQRTGASPGWLILDESFTGLGAKEMESCVEILRAFAQDRLVLVVDHASEFKEAFSEFVNVQYEGGRSRVE